MSTKMTSTQEKLTNNLSEKKRKYNKKSLLHRYYQEFCTVISQKNNKMPYKKFLKCLLLYVGCCTLILASRFYIMSYCNYSFISLLMGSNFNYKCIIVNTVYTRSLEYHIGLWTNFYVFLIKKPPELFVYISKVVI